MIEIVSRLLVGDFAFLLLFLPKFCIVDAYSVDCTACYIFSQNVMHFTLAGSNSKVGRTFYY